MKSVGLIITRMIPGGASKIVQQIISNNGEYRFTLFTGPQDMDTNIINEIQKNAEVKVIPSLVRNIRPCLDINAYLRLKDILSQKKFDVIHTHTSKAGFIGRLAAIKNGIPKIIHTPHGSIYTKKNKIEGVPQFSLGKSLIRKAERFVGKDTTYLTVLSQHEREICINMGLGTEKNIIVIPNGIDYREFSISQRERNNVRIELNINPDDLMLLSVGRLSAEKGHSILIKAFLRALSDNPKLKLAIVGDGPLKSKLVKFSEQSENKGKILFYGYKKNIRKYLASADVFVLPSLYEGFGLAVIEAMAMGLPVIATTVGGIPEIISDGIEGYLVEPSNCIALATKILHLSASSETRRNMGVAGKEKAKQFSLEKMLQGYYNLYRN